MSTYIVTFFSRVIDSNISPNTATKNCPTSLRNNFIHSKWTGFKQFSNTHATKFVFAIVFGLIVRQGLIFKVITLIVNQVVCLINRGSLAGPIKMEPTKIGPCPFTLAYPLIPFCSFCSFWAMFWHKPSLNMLSLILSCKLSLGLQEIKTAIRGRVLAGVVVGGLGRGIYHLSFSR